MKRLIFHRVSLILSVSIPALLFSSCTKEPVAGAGSVALSFSTDTPGLVEVKAEAVTSVDDFMAMGFSGATQWFPDPSTSTSPERVQLSSGSKVYSNYLWPKGAVKAFYAYSNNLPTGATASIISSGVTLTYTAIPTTAKAQTDVTLGNYSGNGNDEGKAAMTFYHPLAQVVIVSDGLAHFNSISEIELNGVYTSGEATLSGTTISWTNCANPGNVSQTITTALPDSGQIGIPFMLIPQAFSGSSTIKLTVSAIFEGVSKSFTTTIDEKAFVAGKKTEIHIKYVLGPALNYTVTLAEWVDVQGDIRLNK